MHKAVATDALFVPCPCTACSEAIGETYSGTAESSKIPESGGVFQTEKLRDPPSEGGSLNCKQFTIERSALLRSVYNFRFVFDHSQSICLLF